MLVEDFCIRKESGEKMAHLLLVENPVQSMSVVLDEGPSLRDRNPISGATKKGRRQAIQLVSFVTGQHVIRPTTNADSGVVCEVSGCCSKLEKGL
jgi:hypothetical protein